MPRNHLGQSSLQVFMGYEHFGRQYIQSLELSKLENQFKLPTILGCVFSITQKGPGPELAVCWHSFPAGACPSPSPGSQGASICAAGSSKVTQKITEHHKTHHLPFGEGSSPGSCALLLGSGTIQRTDWCGAFAHRALSGGAHSRRAVLEGALVGAALEGGGAALGGRAHRGRAGARRARLLHGAGPGRAPPHHDRLQRALEGGAALPGAQLRHRPSGCGARAIAAHILPRF